MATYTRIDNQAQISLSDKLAALGLGRVKKVVGIPAGSVNSNYRIETVRLGAGAEEPDRYFLRLYEEQDRAGAESEARLLAHLAAAGVKTPAPLSWDPMDEGAQVIEMMGKPASLFAWIEGEMRCQASVTTEDARAVGEALAHVHLSGAGIEEEIGGGRFRIDDLYRRLERIAGAEDTTLKAQAEPIEARLKKAVAARDTNLPTGLVHGDLFRDNVLWGTNGQISALLDFESASRGVWAYDLAVTVLAWTFGHGFDDQLASALIAGYDRVRKLTPAERKGFAAECVVAALRFTITRITDYAMRANEGGDRVLKDWRRFDARAHAIEANAKRIETEWMPLRS